MNNILITSAGTRVSLVKIFKKELNKKFSNGRVFTCDMNPENSPACLLSDGYFKVSHAENKDYAGQLLKLCKKNKVKIIIPTIDTELIALAKRKEVFFQSGIEIIISDLSFIMQCRDKRKIHEFFNYKKIKVAREYGKNNYKIPFFIKPIDGSRSKNNFVIDSKEKLSNYHIKDNKFLFLQYFDLADYNEYTCDLYYGKDSVIKCIVPRKRIEVRDGEVSKGITEKNQIVEYIYKKLNKINGARGCLTAQFFMHKLSNNIIGIEINPRFGGGYPLSYKAGANFPEWIIYEYMQNKKGGIL